MGEEPNEKATNKRPGGNYEVPPEKQILVAIINNKPDLKIVEEERWYRIPVKSAPHAIDARFLAFYQTKIFKEEGWAVRYWAEVKRRPIVLRKNLFPDKPDHPRANEQYYKFELGPLKRREPPIISRRGRRITFIPTTWEKFQRAREINDLFHDSPLEDELWDAFQQERIEAERQYYLSVEQQTYCLDFALFCQAGNVAVECDGDRWHSERDQIAQDNERDNILESRGWSVLRFNTPQIYEDMPRCLQRVRETVNRYGGLVTPEQELRFFAQGNDRGKQLNLFQETQAEYSTRMQEEADSDEPNE